MYEEGASQTGASGGSQTGYSHQSGTYVSSLGNNGAVSALSQGDYVELHELAKGWKAAIFRAFHQSTRHEVSTKNDRGNLPLHTAASFRAPLEVAEALLEVYPEAASQTNNYGNLALHFTAWKKGPLEVEKLLLKVFPEGAAQKNNHGNLPLHYAAHYNAPLEVVEALYNAYPAAAQQRNNDNNTPLDLAIADGASPNVVALLQGKSVPPTDDELLESAKNRCERVEKEVKRSMETHDSSQEDLEAVLSLLMDVKDGHSHALFSAGIDPTEVGDMDSLLEQVRRSAEKERGSRIDDDVGMHVEEDDQLEEALAPPRDEVEMLLGRIIGLDSFKNHVRGLRRTLEILKFNNRVQGPRHVVLMGNPGSGKTYLSRLLMLLMHKIGAVSSSNCVEATRDDLIDRKSESRTVFKTRKVIERATGGVLFVDEPYNLLPSPGRQRGRDHGAAALRELARALPSGDPLVILAGYAPDMTRVLSSALGFKGHFLLRMELPDPVPRDVARIFLAKLSSRGLIAGDGVTVDYLADLLLQHTDEEWRSERNGFIADLLLFAVRVEMKRKTAETLSRSSAIKVLTPTSQKMPTYTSEEVTVTIEDIQNAVMNGI